MPNRSIRVIARKDCMILVSGFFYHTGMLRLASVITFIFEGSQISTVTLILHQSVKDNQIIVPA